MAHFSRFRLVDQVALALERGNEHVIAQIRDRSIPNLGPMIETLTLGRTKPAFGELLSICAARPVADAVSDALRQPLRLVHGGSNMDQWAALGLRPAPEPEWADAVHAFQLQIQKALRGHRRASAARARICGATKEMIDNIFDHSGAPETGVVALWGRHDCFEISVGDAGVGILPSLQTNPKFSYLRDAGTAMAEALKDGNSRYGPAQDRGYGFGTLFRALNTLDAELRFRSGDYALEIAGRGPSLRNPRISQKAELKGFVVSIQIAL